MIVCRGLGTSKALLATAGLGLALTVTPVPPVEQYTGGWWEHDHRPTAEQVQAERERLGILPARPAAKSAPAPAPRPTARPARPLPAPAEPQALAWAADRLQAEHQFAGIEAALRLDQARRAAEARQAAAQREEEDVAYVLAALAEGLGVPVAVTAVALPASPEADLAFVIATLVSIA